MAAFSSIGPNRVTPEILKVFYHFNIASFKFINEKTVFLTSIYTILSFQPDITAPGVNILAAYTGDQGPSEIGLDNRQVKFNTMTGTSMSCPHVAGVAGLLKTLHPTWSPAAIKSAIMTSGRT